MQIFSDAQHSPTPLIAAVGELQLQVFQARMASEYNEQVKLDRLPFTRMRWLGSDIKPSSSTLTFAFDDADREVILFKNDWEIGYHQDRTEGLTLLEKPPIS